MSARRRPRARRVPRGALRPTVALALGLALALPLPAAAAAPRASLPDIEDEVMCPVCGTSLDIAEAPQAERQRELIRDLIGQGRTKEEIKAVLVREYGPDVLALPDDEGFGLAAYLVPALAVGLGLAGVGAAAVRWRRGRRPSEEAAPAPLPAEDARRLEADLAAHDL